ncbi:MAG: 30S ribosome-binding factor RbfA [Planctomycetales bacterium]|jgi:ribosome-binding factor A
MVSRRVARLSQAVREVVSTAILFHLRDPRIKNVTVLRVEVAGDVRTAKVYVSVLGTEKEQALCLHGLNASKGFIQSRVADRIETRYTPVLKFVLENAVSSSAEEAVRILEELEQERLGHEVESGVADTPEGENPDDVEATDSDADELNMEVEAQDES